MIFRVGIENNNEGYRSIAWALEHPGCFAYGPDADAALDALAESIPAYAAWIGRHEPPWFASDNIELAVEDTWDDYEINEAFDRVEKDGYAVEPFFLHDWKPLTEGEIERGLKVLAWSRADLLATVEGLTGEQRQQQRPDERWSIQGILAHVGGAEWWYLDRLGLAFPRENVPKDPMQRLFEVRIRLNDTLPTLKGLVHVVGVDGELWSPRKILRRAAWHERDHTDHIRKLLRLSPK